MDSYFSGFQFGYVTVHTLTALFSTCELYSKARLLTEESLSKIPITFFFFPLILFATEFCSRRMSEVKFRTKVNENKYVCVGIKEAPVSLSPSCLKWPQHHVIHEPGSIPITLNWTVCEFITWREVLSSFYSEIRKDDELIHLSIIFFTSPTGIQGMLIWSSRCTELMELHQKGSVKPCALPVNLYLLLHNFEPHNPYPSG